MHTEMLIGSRFVKGTEHEEKIFNPRTGEVILALPEASNEQVDAAVAAAEKAFLTWSRTTPAERAGYLLRLADRIAAAEQEFADLGALNCGKPRHTVLRDETPAVIDVIRFFAGAARVVPASAAGEYLPGFTSMVRRDPIGVVASIAPWNYPLMMAAWKMSPALAAGNTVVLKPSEQTPLSTLKLARIAAEILPEGVFNVVVGRGETVGNALINHPKVAMISLTGDIATGKKVLTAAAKSVKRTHLELGGKAPVIVFDDADITAVVEGVRVFGYANAGQDCTAACRIYAGAKVYDRLVADLSSAVSTITFGRDNDAENEIGPLISERQRERVASFVERASGLKHVEIATGGKRGPGSGFYYVPTVVAGARQEDEIVRREVFGPVVSITRFDDPEKA
ncbi:MAG: aminobutyraldehyde dehydrogenase, partial [Bauldia sp.]|nr:aminobutyraldehyde dehydrogenase [Bauldia sp.]